MKTATGKKASMSKKKTPIPKLPKKVLPAKAPSASTKKFITSLNELATSFSAKKTDPFPVEKTDLSGVEKKKKKCARKTRHLSIVVESVTKSFKYQKPFSSSSPEALQLIITELGNIATSFDRGISELKIQLK